VAFKVFTVGWELPLINQLLTPVEKKTGIEFTHGLVGDVARIDYVQRQFPDLSFVSLSKKRNEPLPAPDYELLASLECVGVPTIKSMVQGDPYVRYRSKRESFCYATLLARSLEGKIKELKPSVVLANYDCIHSGMSLAVAKYMNIPWVAMAFGTIPDNLTGFCFALTPNSIVPISRKVSKALKYEAKAIIENVRSGEQNVMAYRAPANFFTWAKQYAFHGSNLIKRIVEKKIKGTDEFTAPTKWKRVKDITRRSLNSLLLPTGKLLKTPPSRPYAYYPLHMSPESMVDTWAPFYQDQLAFIEQLSISMPADVELVVKLHFSDPSNYSRSELLRLIRRYHVHVASPFVPSRDFLERASLVIGITGTTNLEAALRGKPVLIFGDSQYQHFPRSERAKRPHEIYGQVRRMLDRPAPSDEEIEEAYAAYMARYLPGRINDWSIPIEPAEMDRYAECFARLRRYILNSVNVSNWYNQPPFAGGADQGLQ
jgi:hypothetical protein